MRILLLGYNGQVGWELLRALAPLGQVIPLDYPEIDLAHPEDLPAVVRRLQPDVVINAAAYNDVNGAEADPDKAMAVNGIAPGTLAEVIRSTRAALIHYSSDYVFDGTKGEPYVESDPATPLSAYGRSKLAGEEMIQQVGGAYLILRTAWVYSLRRGSFVTKVLDWSRKQPVLRVVDDQVSNPTWCRMLAEATAQLLAMAGHDPAGWLEEHAGLYHLAGSGYASRFEWAGAILALDPQKETQLAEKILPANSADFPAPAIRPAFSALDCARFSKTFGLRLPPWQEALRLAMQPG